MTIGEREKKFLEQAIELSRQGMLAGKGGPFGCIIVKEDRVIAGGYNMVTSLNDPTAHAEVVAIREACRVLGDYQLTDCEMYSSCEPCPMCLGAIYWARPARVIYVNTRDEAAAIAFDDAFIYHELTKDLGSREIPFIHYPHVMAKQVFDEWLRNENRKMY